MKHWHCNDCHHEWDGSDGSCCDWCGGSGHVLEQETAFTRFMRDWQQGWRPPGWPFSRDRDTNPVDSAK